MGIAKFNADVVAVGKKAAAGTIPGIKSVVPSPVSGQVLFTISDKSLSRDFKIRATCESPDDYPDETAFTLYVTHGTPSHVADALKSTQDFLVAMRLYEVALTLSTALETACPSTPDSEEEDPDEEMQDSDDDEFDDWSNGQFGIPSNAAPLSSHEPGPEARRMRLDLRQARDAGHKVGFLDDAAKVGRGGIVSLSIRIKKLELSPDLMEAWDVEPTDYFVLLIKFGPYYSTLDSIIERPAEGTQIAFRVGKCGFYKPSPEQAARAFIQNIDRRTTSDARESTDGPGSSAAARPETAFRKLFVSNSLDQYLNTHLLRLIKIRNRDQCTWDAANETYRQQSTSRQVNSATGPNPPLSRPARVRSSPGAAHLLSQDHWRDAGRQGSFPLVAMQFAMRNFMNCNSFCLVCHRLVDGDEIEALRPYVCSDPLCLFQYLSMGFGPSIEHEILTQPLVVDLLVSLCYAALVLGGKPPIRDLPVGLQLRVPNVFNNTIKALHGKMDSSSNDNSAVPPNSDGRIPRTLDVPPTSLPTGTKLYPGQWIAFLKPTDRVLRHAQIKDIVGPKVYVEEAASSFLNAPPMLAAGVHSVMTSMSSAAAYGTAVTYGTAAAINAPLPSAEDPTNVEIYFYDADFDSFADTTKIEAMRLILDTLPSVRDMAEYLQKHPDCTVRSMPRVTPAAASLLAWIISTNRSCIYQIDRSLPKLPQGGTGTARIVPANVQPAFQLGGQPAFQLGGQPAFQPGLQLRGPAGGQPQVRIFSANGQFGGQTGWQPGVQPAGRIGGQPAGRIGGQPQGQSNTGCVPGPALPSSTSAGEAVIGGRNREQERIGGMNGWVQFRFAQGSPDKELRFKQALQAEAALTPKLYPTVLGWHGSRVCNWHSILRTGLDFGTIVNGRSFGNGVYFSPHYQTSAGYCGGGIPAMKWKNSEIAVQSCVSLNEIINCPQKWVSRQPHYVIAQPDWHQCRYLFVERAVRPEAALTQSASTTTGPKPKLFPQEAGWEIIGPGNTALTVPLAAIPTALKLQAKASSPSKRKSLKYPDSDEDEEDRALLFSDSEEHEVESRYPSRKRQSFSLASTSSVSRHQRGEARDAGPTNGARSAPATRRPAVAEKKMTDFVPGSLNLATLPRLAEPSFSNNMALRALGRELSKLQSVQAKTPLHELGWYLHAEAVTNLFQWIVELHSFDASLPLAQDMKKLGMTSIVLELRFPGDFPMSPPFVRVVRPRFLPFAMGGGGHVTGGGAMCMELLTTTGWSPAYSMESVLLQVRLAMTNLEPRPGRIWEAVQNVSGGANDYGVSEAIEAYQRAVRFHGWTIPKDLMATAQGA